MERHPDSALLFLQQFSVDDCRDREQKAYYNLLLTQALDKTYRSITDAPITSALAFYRHSEDSLKKQKPSSIRGGNIVRRKNMTRLFVAICVR